MESSTMSQTIFFRFGASGWSDSSGTVVAEDAAAAAAVEDDAIGEGLDVVRDVAEAGIVTTGAGTAYSGSGVDAAATNLPYFKFAAGTGGSCGSDFRFEPIKQTNL